MKSKNAFRIVLLILGCTLLLASIVSLAFSAFMLGSVNVNVENTVDFLESVIPANTTAGTKEERYNNEMPSVTYEEQDYSAILTISRFSVTLPVRSTWDKTVVNKVPCRFTGSVYDGTLIIGGEDAEGQFDFVPLVDIGDVITVTDMKGYEFTYTVSTVKHAKNSKASTLIDENYDLTLFAKDKKTGDWLLVRCNMK